MASDAAMILDEPLMMKPELVIEGVWGSDMTAEGRWRTQLEKECGRAGGEGIAEAQMKVACGATSGGLSCLQEVANCLY